MSKRELGPVQLRTGSLSNIFIIKYINEKFNPLPIAYAYSMVQGEESSISDWFLVAKIFASEQHSVQTTRRTCSS